jgi:hypothetical protein
VRITSASRFAVAQSDVGLFVGVDVALLAAALIVISLLDLADRSPGSFSLDAEDSSARMRATAQTLRVVIAGSGAGTVVGLVSSSFASRPLRDLSFALSILTVAAFVALCFQTITAIVHRR